MAALAPVVPVLTIGRTADAVPLARALVKGGLPVLEITLRTATALEALKAIATEVPDAVVGAGTVLKPGQFDQIRQAGAPLCRQPGLHARACHGRPGRRIAILAGYPDRIGGNGLG
jgi:2-dehydro-3-deoxyphosphogluconate aldolase/(4S)-4-hydroxy-2-oxoglutarate aldolase